MPIFLASLIERWLERRTLHIYFLRVSGSITTVQGERVESGSSAKGLGHGIACSIIPCFKPPFRVYPGDFKEGFIL